VTARPAAGIAITTPSQRAAAARAVDGGAAMTVAFTIVSDFSRSIFVFQLTHLVAKLLDPPMLLCRYRKHEIDTSSGISGG